MSGEARQQSKQYKENKQITHHGVVWEQTAQRKKSITVAWWRCICVVPLTAWLLWQQRRWWWWCGGADMQRCGGHTFNIVLSMYVGIYNRTFLCWSFFIIFVLAIPKTEDGKNCGMWKRLCMAFLSYFCVYLLYVSIKVEWNGSKLTNKPNQRRSGFWRRMSIGQLQDIPRSGQIPCVTCFAITSYDIIAKQQRNLCFNIFFLLVFENTIQNWCDWRLWFVEIYFDWPGHQKEWLTRRVKATMAAPTNSNMKFYSIPAHRRCFFEHKISYIHRASI